MKAIETELKGCFIIEPTIYTDERGHFFESFNQKKFSEVTGIDISFRQDNQAQSCYGVIRGLHLQREDFLQAKLVRVLFGKVLDVAIDLRKNSPTYGQYIAVELSEENKQQLFIPHGFAHGYAVLSPKAIVAYKCDGYYEKSAEDSVYLFDPNLNVDWKIPREKAILSEKDKKAKSFLEFTPIELIK